jgi:TRAP-type C4-dicarboxylate transport system permease small subunit
MVSRIRRSNCGGTALKISRWRLLLATMIVLPLAEIALRQFSVGIPSAPEFLRHLTLLVGMLGGALAAREGRLLALASSSRSFPRAL